MEWVQINRLADTGVEFGRRPRISHSEALQKLRDGKTVMCVEGNSNTNLNVVFRIIQGEFQFRYTHHTEGWEKVPSGVDSALNQLARWDPESLWVEVQT